MGSMGAHPYTRGLYEIAGGVFAYLQPDGGWGWSNAGLVVDGKSSLLIDTLFDLNLTGEMLAAMRRATAAARSIDVVVNTHANGDHCWGTSWCAVHRSSPPDTAPPRWPSCRRRYWPGWPAVTATIGAPSGAAMSGW